MQEGEDPDQNIKDALNNTSSVAIVANLLTEVFKEIDEEIHLKETLKKLPKFNVMYSVDLVQEVNSLLIKDYDRR